MAEYNWKDSRDVITALITLYEMQTADEKQSQATSHLNGVGFSASDAGILTSISQQILEKKFITEKQLDLVRLLCQRHAKQLSLLDRSEFPAIYECKIVIKSTKEKTNGILSTDGRSLFFLPKIYPSAQIKNLGNFRWKGKEIGWEGPLKEPIIWAVKEQFDPVDLDDSILEWIEQNNKPVELSKAVTESTLFPGQKRTTAGLLKSKRGMAALRPGLGKTASAIFAGNELDRKKYDGILAVCPLTLVNNWKKEIKKWINEEAVIWHGNVDSWDPYYRWVITNYETVSRNTEDIIAQGFKVIIFDETILIKNRKAKRTEACKEISKNADYVWLLSGSPTSHFLDDIWSQLNIVDSKRFSSYWKFVERYCEKETNTWGTSVVGNKPGATEELMKDLSDIYFTASENEFPEIPDWIFDTVEIPMSKEQYRLYDEMEREFLATLPNGDEVLAPIVLTQLLRLIQFASNPLLLDGPDDSNKWEAAIDMLEYEQGPFIIWTNFKRTAELMLMRLSRKYRAAMLTGSTPASERQKIVDAMQNGELDVIVAHPAVGKFGLTLTKVRTAIYLERSYNGDDHYQSLFRIRRIGTTIPPHVIYLISSRPTGNSMTVDHVIDSILSSRKENSIALTSGMITSILGKI